jgi:hypothetical protein
MPVQRHSFLLGLIFASAVSVAGEPVKLDNKFDVNEVSFVKVPGTSTVAGTAFLKLADGSIKDCAGFNIELLPVAAYSRERITNTYGNDQQGQILLEQDPPKFTPDVPEYHQMVIKGACDSRGAFNFNAVPAGDYFVMAFIIWDDLSAPTPRKAGGGVMKRIRVPPGSRVDVLLKN